MYVNKNQAKYINSVRYFDPFESFSSTHPIKYYVTFTFHVHNGIYLGTCTLFGNFLGNNRPFDVEKNFRLDKPPLPRVPLFTFELTTVRTLRREGKAPR